jgi:hypothetical protein
LLHRFQSGHAFLMRAEPWFQTRIDLMSAGRTPTMRWKISHHGHDVRQIDLLAMLALLVIIVVAYHYFGNPPAPHNTAAFIEPSQSVRW